MIIIIKLVFNQSSGPHGESSRRLSYISRKINPHIDTQAGIYARRIHIYIYMLLWGQGDKDTHTHPSRSLVNMHSSQPPKLPSHEDAAAVHRLFFLSFH